MELNKSPSGDEAEPPSPGGSPGVRFAQQGQTGRPPGDSESQYDDALSEGSMVSGFSKGSKTSAVSSQLPPVATTTLSQAMCDPILGDLVNRAHRQSRQASVLTQESLPSMREDSREDMDSDLDMEEGLESEEGLAYGSATDGGNDTDISRSVTGQTDQSCESRVPKPLNLASTKFNAKTNTLETIMSCEMSDMNSTSRHLFPEVDVIAYKVADEVVLRLKDTIRHLMLESNDHFKTQMLQCIHRLEGMFDSNSGLQNGSRTHMSNSDEGSSVYKDGSLSRRSKDVEMNDAAHYRINKDSRQFMSSPGDFTRGPAMKHFSPSQSNSGTLSVPATSLTKRGRRKSITTPFSHDNLEVAASSATYATRSASIGSVKGVEDDQFRKLLAIHHRSATGMTNKANRGKLRKMKEASSPISPTSCESSSSHHKAAASSSSRSTNGISKLFAGVVPASLAPKHPEKPCTDDDLSHIGSHQSSHVSSHLGDLFISRSSGPALSPVSSKVMTSPVPHSAGDQHQLQPEEKNFKTCPANIGADAALAPTMSPEPLEEGANFYSLDEFATGSSTHNLQPRTVEETKSRGSEGSGSRRAPATSELIMQLRHHKSSSSRVGASTENGDAMATVTPAPPRLAVENAIAAPSIPPPGGRIPTRPTQPMLAPLEREAQRIPSASSSPTGSRLFADAGEAKDAEESAKSSVCPTSAYLKQALENPNMKGALHPILKRNPPNVVGVLNREGPASLAATMPHRLSDETTYLPIPYTIDELEPPEEPRQEALDLHEVLSDPITGCRASLSREPSDDEMGPRADRRSFSESDAMDPNVDTRFISHRRSDNTRTQADLKRTGGRKMSNVRLLNESALIEGNAYAEKWGQRKRTSERLSPTANNGTGFSSTHTVFSEADGYVCGLPTVESGDEPKSTTGAIDIETVDSMPPLLTTMSLDTDMPLTVSVIMALLKVTGVVPVGSTGGFVYQALVIFFLAGAVVMNVIALATGTGTDNFWHLSRLLIVLGAFLGYVALLAGNIGSLLGTATNTLVMYADRHDFLPEWGRTSTRNCAALLFVWACSVISLIVIHAVSWAGGCTNMLSDVVAIVLFVVGSGAFMALSCCLLHVVLMLGMMVDQFCVQFFLDPDFPGSVGEWNVLQAILRRAAGVLDNSFLVLQTTALVSMLMLATKTVAIFSQKEDPLLAEPSCAEAHSFWARLLPLPMTVFSAYCIFFRAASVSEKCSRVPALVNSIMMDQQIHEDRQYVVQYITNSAAGFYVKDVRLSMGMLLKASYFTGVCVFVLITRFISDEEL